MYGFDKQDTQGVAPSLEVVSFNPLDSNLPSGGDFSRFGTSSVASIAYTAFSTSGYNDLALSSVGLQGISKTGLTSLGLRTSAEIAGSPPATSVNNLSQFYIRSAETTGQQPQLVITYSLGVNNPKGGVDSW